MNFHFILSLEICVDTCLEMDAKTERPTMENRGPPESSMSAGWLGDWNQCHRLAERTREPAASTTDGRIEIESMHVY